MKVSLTFFQALVLSCLIGLLTISLLFLSDLNKSRRVMEADLFYKMTHDFFRLDSANRKLIISLGEGTPIFTENGGPYDAFDVDDYLAHFEILKNYMDEGIFSEKKVYTTYSYYIVQAYQNKEVWDYVLWLRNETKDSSYYRNFELLANKFIEANQNQKYPSH